jgi:hypothetical protein
MRCGKNVVQWGRTQMTVQAHAHCMLHTSGYKHTHSSCVNTHCFSTTTKAARTRLNVTLYAHCPKCSYCLDTSHLSYGLKAGLAGLRIALARGIHCCPNFFFFCARPAPQYCEELSAYTHISDCVQLVYELPLLINSTAVKRFYTNQERCEVLTWIFTSDAPAWQ